MKKYFRMIAVIIISCFVFLGMGEFQCDEEITSDFANEISLAVGETYNNSMGVLTNAREDIREITPNALLFNPQITNPQIMDMVKALPSGNLFSDKRLNVEKCADYTLKLTYKDFNCTDYDFPWGYSNGIALKKTVINSGSIEMIIHGLKPFDMDVVMDLKVQYGNEDYTYYAKSKIIQNPNAANGFAFTGKFKINGKEYNQKAY